MGFLESAVVVYLRELYYPHGFRFPLVPLPDRIMLVEVVREATTVVMMLVVAVLAGRDRMDRFFVFCFLFGVWDIVYYIGLWVFLGWPESLLTWDILFLIPVPWVGPVLCPVIISCALIAGFLIHDRLRGAGRHLLPRRGEWLIASAGAVVIVVAFCWNWRIAWSGDAPRDFPVTLFIAGWVLAVAPFLRALRRS